MTLFTCSHVNKGNPYFRWSLLYTNISASNKTVWRKIARNLSCPQTRCARRVRESLGVMNSTLPDLAATVSLRLAKEVCVYTLFSIVVSKNGSKLYYHCSIHVYMLGLIWCPNGCFSQRLRRRSHFCVRSLCCLNIWYRECCLVGDVFSVSCLISDVCSVARGSTIFMENIDFDLTLFRLIGC
jgi:hypothetical protein